MYHARTYHGMPNDALGLNWKGKDQTIYPLTIVDCIILFCHPETGRRRDLSSVHEAQVWNQRSHFHISK